MTTYTNGKDLAAATRARNARIKAMLGTVVMRQAAAGKATSRGITHGPQRPAGFRGKVSPVRPIGRRSGKLFKSWRVRRLASDPGSRSVVLYNTAGHHQYVLRPGGTKRMTDRGYWQAQREASAQTRIKIAKRELDKALKG